MGARSAGLAMASVSLPLLSSPAPACASVACSATQSRGAPLEQFRFASVGTGRSRDQTSVPVKDRYPPAKYDPSDTNLRLVVLVDGNLVSWRSVDGLKDAFAKIGRPMLIRMFSHELKKEWHPAIVAKEVEWFRVEKFIPIHMQIVADAGHVVRYRNDNSTQGLCFVVADVETPQYVEYFSRPELRGVGLYCFGESKGLVKAVEPDSNRGFQAKPLP